ncbi:MAG: tRNA pseudouridine(38-40) synthase TruA [Proteobacteria bacterium]|nr:tRNA pseudouridine(38-40) synthase TruA [Pseudomonadota bacterium]
MPRYRIIIEYDGTPFVGWQIQADGRSVQGRLTEAVEAFSGERVSIRGAGRTDTGVHAKGQVAHFDLARDWEPFKVREALNFHLKPDPIVILDADRAASDFDARFSAVKRHYLYRILARKGPPALDRNRVWWVPRPLSAEAMAEAATHVIGRHDFTTFRAAGCQAASPVKTLDRLDVIATGEEIRIEASARSFLHHQVRSLVGSLKHVGEGKWQPDDMRAALESRDRARCGALAPSRGLYLVAVDYPPPAPSEGAAA